MGNYEDVIMNYEVTEGCMLDHMQISEDEAKALKALGEVHGDLMSYWLGDSGEVFRKMASTIEVEMGDAVRFSDNCAIGNDQLIVNFGSADSDRADSIGISSEGGVGCCGTNYNTDR